jgi:hypothetical protein
MSPRVNAIVPISLQEKKVSTTIPVYLLKKVFELT